MRTLDFIQIYFREEQVKELYPFATPHFNTTLTPYFENQCICDLVPTLGSDLISICSWRLRRKRGDSEVVLRRGGTFELTYENIISKDFDIAVLTPRSSAHKPLAMARNWHGEAWVEAFLVLKKFLASDLGIKVPDELTHAIYENHFCAKRELFHEYVERCLKPTISFIENDRATKGDCASVFFEDSGYIKKLIRDGERIKDYKEKTGRSDYPIAPFILERLFSIWIEGNGYNIINL